MSGLGGLTASRIGFQVVEAENAEHRNGQRGLLRLLQASDPRSGDFSAEHVRKPKNKGPATSNY